MISLINCIDTPPNPNINNMLAIVDSGVNIHLEKQATTAIASVIMLNKISSRIPDGSTRESSHIATLQISVLSKQARQVHIFPKMNTAPLISLGVLFDYGRTITLEKKEMAVQNNGQEIIKGTRNKKNGTWEVPLDTQQPSAVINNIQEQSSKPELAQYLHAALFSPTTASLLKAIKQGFLKTWPGLNKKTYQEAYEKSRNTKMGHLHMRI